MPEWLFQVIEQADRDRRPDFARSSALNWMRALSAEIVRAHGESAEAQYRSLRAHFRNVKPRTVPHLAAVFEPAFASITYSTSLVSLASQGAVEPWRAPGAVVEWYYAVYTALRAILAASGEPALEKHVKVADALNGQIRQRLPHPLDMHAEWERNEEFHPELPRVPGARPREGNPNPLTEDYDGTERHAQEMLLAYLRGTARFYVKRIKAELLESDAFRRAGLTSFHSRTAKDQRDARLRRKEYNFLHLAFRYRGKSNYRDAIFLSYGQGRLADARSYVVDLATSARFVTLCAMAYVQQRVGEAVFQHFSNDLQENFRGQRVLLADLAR